MLVRTFFCASRHSVECTLLPATHGVGATHPAPPQSHVHLSGCRSIEGTYFRRLRPAYSRRGFALSAASNTADPPRTPPDRSTQATRPPARSPLSFRTRTQEYRQPHD